MIIAALFLVQRSLEDQLRQRLELQMAHKTYLEVKEQQMLAHKAEEAEFRRQMMEKFAEDERLEQMTAQKRRMKQLGWCKGLYTPSEKRACNSHSDCTNVQCY